MRLLLLILPLAACDGGHLGNPLTLPVRGVVSGLENASYAARRDTVSTYLAHHRTHLNDPGIQSGLWDIAPIPPKRRAKVLREIAALMDSPDWVEQATVIVMVHHN